MVNVRTVALVGALVAAIAVASSGLVIGMRHVPLPGGMSGCRFLGDKFERSDCLASRLEVSVRSDGVVPSLEQLERLYDESGGVRESCHDAGHTAALKLLRPKGVHGQLTTIMRVRGDCVDGYFHGSMIAALSGGSRQGVLDLARFCGGPEMGDSAMRQSCNHAIGHGVTSHASLASGLETCAQVYDDDLVKADCQSGAFMQYGMDHTADMRRTGDVQGSCADITEQSARSICWAYVPSNAMALQWPVERIAATCMDDAPTDTTRSACLRGMGLGQLDGGGHACFDLKRTADITSCARGFFQRNVVDFQDLTPRKAVALCSSQREQRVVEACTVALGAAWKLSAWPEPGKKTCRREVHGSALEWCLRGYATKWPDSPLSTA